MSDDVRQVRPHRSGGGAPFLNEAEDRQYAEWARAQDDDHLQHWATGSPADRDAMLKQIAAKRESQRRANTTPPTANSQSPTNSPQASSSGMPEGGTVCGKCGHAEDAHYVARPDTPQAVRVCDECDCTSPTTDTSKELERLLDALVRASAKHVDTCWLVGHGDESERCRQPNTFDCPHVRAAREALTAYVAELEATTSRMIERHWNQSLEVRRLEGEREALDALATARGAFIIKRNAEVATLREDALTPEEAKYLLDGSYFTPDVTEKLRRIASHSAATEPTE